MSENTSLDAIFCRAIEIAEDKERAKKAAGEVSPPKQIPHRPGQAPALGLRAGTTGLFILSQTSS